MAEAIISPGVFTRENDISFIQPAPVEAGAAIIGPTVKGPVEKPTLVTSYNDYVRTFGATFESASTSYEFMTSLAVKNYFSQGGNSVLVSRVVSGAYDPATSTKITGSLLPDAPATAPFALETLGEGVIFNNSTGPNDPGVENSDGSLVSGSSDNLRWEISNIVIHKVLSL